MQRGFTWIVYTLHAAPRGRASHEVVGVQLRPSSEGAVRIAVNGDSAGRAPTQ